MDVFPSYRLLKIRYANIRVSRLASERICHLCSHEVVGSAVEHFVGRVVHKLEGSLHLDVKNKKNDEVNALAKPSAGQLECPEIRRSRPLGLRLLLLMAGSVSVSIDESSIAVNLVGKHLQKRGSCGYMLLDASCTCTTYNS